MDGLHDAMTAGDAPAEFEFGRTGQGGPPRWLVVDDATASGGRAIEQASTDRTDYRFPLAMHKAVSVRDVDVSLRFKPVAGTVDQAGGIAVRLSDADNYYVARANALEDNVVAYKVVAGRRTALAPVGTPAGTYGVKTKVAGGAWHTLRADFSGSEFTVLFDGQRLFSVRDDTFAEAGKVGIWSKADSVTEFERPQHGDKS